MTEVVNSASPVAVTIRFRFNAKADKRHSSLTRSRPLFLALFKLCSRLSAENVPLLQIARNLFIAL